MAHSALKYCRQGSVRFTDNHGCYLGELPEARHHGSRPWGTLFARVGIVATVTPHIQSFEWSKYVAWVCGMAPAVLTRLETQDSPRPADGDHRGSDTA